MTAQHAAAQNPFAFLATMVSSFHHHVCTSTHNANAVPQQMTVPGQPQRDVLKVMQDSGNKLTRLVGRADKSSRSM